MQKFCRRSAKKFPAGRKDLAGGLGEDRPDSGKRVEERAGGGHNLYIRFNTVFACNSPVPPDPAIVGRLDRTYLLITEGLAGLGFV